MTPKYRYITCNKCGRVIKIFTDDFAIHHGKFYCNSVECNIGGEVHVSSDSD